MLSTKTTLVADLLYGSIALSPLEKRLISTRAFNRLHNVLQNSTVYFTYPSNRTSRFSHSLGVTKIAGEIFRSSFLNGSKEVVGDFLKDAGDAIQRLTNTDSFRTDRSSLAELRPEQQNIAAAKALGCHFYNTVLVPDLDDGQAGTFIVLIQSIRFVALLHDLGHPPFSHVAEFALRNIYLELLNKHATAPSTASPKEVAVLNQLKDFLSRGDSAAFHEIVGFAIAEALLDSLLKELQGEKCQPRQVYSAMLIKHVVLAILRDEGFFSILHQIVASDLDADRLDYTQRDLITSGISREPFRPDRLIQSYTLIKNPKDAERKYEFLPSVRSLNNIEDFFTQRFQLYKYVVYHHRVVKFDGLMEKCIEDLARRVFSRPDEEAAGNPSSRGNDGLVLTAEISGLWQLLSNEVMTQPAQRENFYIQWDDAWLLSLLRKEYFRIKKEREDSSHGGDEPRKEVLEIRLEELLSNRKHYFTLFKRAECFLSIDHAFAKAVSDLAIWKGLEGRLCDSAPEDHRDRIRREIELIKNYVNSLVSAVDNARETTLIVEKHGYLITRLITLLKSILGRGVGIDFLFTAAKTFRESRRQEVEDIVIIQKTLNPGLKRHFLLADNYGKPIEIGTVSRIADELERSAMLFPPFFAYVLVKNAESFDQSLESLRNEFGVCLAKEFSKWSRE